MKPFNLEAAKAGAPIQTRHGTPVKFVAHDPELRKASRVITRAGELLYTHYEDGHSDCGPSYDLFMATTTQTYWVNVYSLSMQATKLGLGRLHVSEAAAAADSREFCSGQRIQTIQVEITL